MIVPATLNGVIMRVGLCEMGTRLDPPKDLGHPGVALEEGPSGVSRGHDVLHRRDEHPAVREKVRPRLDLEMQPPAVPACMHGERVKGQGVRGRERKCVNRVVQKAVPAASRHLWHHPVSIVSRRTGGPGMLAAHWRARCTQGWAWGRGGGED